MKKQWAWDVSLSQFEAMWKWNGIKKAHVWVARYLWESAELRPGTRGTARCHRMTRAARSQWCLLFPVPPIHACRMTPRSPDRPTPRTASSQVCGEDDNSLTKNLRKNEKSWATGECVCCVCERVTHVTTALGFFSTAYTRSFLSACLAARREALTKGPLPAPRTINTLRWKRVIVNNQTGHSLDLDTEENDGGGATHWTLVSFCSSGTLSRRHLYTACKETKRFSLIHTFWLEGSTLIWNWAVVIFYLLILGVFDRILLKHFICLGLQIVHEGLMWETRRQAIVSPTHMHDTQYSRQQLVMHTYLKGRLEVILVTLGKHLVGVGGRSVLVEIFEVLQVGAKVFLTVATGSCEDELGFQLQRENKQKDKKWYNVFCWIAPFSTWMWYDSFNGVTLNRRKIILWCAFDRTGNPFLLVRKMLVGRMAALIGSPSHLSITESEGMSSPTSMALRRQKTLAKIVLKITSLFITTTSWFI